LHPNFNVDNNIQVTCIHSLDVLFFPYLTRLILWKGDGQMNKTTRRQFLTSSALGFAASGLLTTYAHTKPKSLRQKNGFSRLNFGMASYTLRKFDLDNTLKMTNRLGLKNIAFKSFHLPLDSTPQDIASVAAKVKEAGLNLYGGGVVYMEDADQVNNAFEYARLAGMQVIIGVPEHGLLPLVEQRVKEYDIKVAIHNHGPSDKRYPTPQSVYEKVRNLDKRIGLCLDIGHTQRSGIEPFEPARLYAARLLDVHIKDVDAATAEGKPVEIGRGVIDIPEFLATLMEIQFTGKVSLEYEKDADDPLPGCAESIGYLRGVMAVI
jgi:inosose dehydratase